MLNSTKSEVMFVGGSILFSKSNLSAKITFDATYLSVSSKLKILGVTLDPCLNFTHFASQIIQAFNFHLHAIKQVRKFLSFNTVVALTISLVLSRLDFCNSLFCGLPNCLIFKLQSLQNRAAKTVLQAITFLYLVLASIAFIGSLMSLKSLNSGLWLHQPVSTNSFSYRSFSHIAPHLYNSFPLNLRFLPFFENFRKRSKTHLSNRISLP